MSKFKKRIVLIGSGNVGNSFIYAAINRGLVGEYGIIDLNKEVVQGQVYDFEDTMNTSARDFDIFVADYKDCKDADIIVITAGRPQKPGETRIEMANSNAVIIKSIAEKVKASGFKGITIIVSNPVDIMTAVYKHVTGFYKTKVLSSGTSLDSARLTNELGRRLKVSSRGIKAFVMGEHGDSSVSAFSSASVGGKQLMDIAKDGGIDPKDFPAIHKYVWKRAYEIIQTKGSTYYGVGSSLANLCSQILNDTNEIIPVGVYLEGEYGHTGVFTGVPAIINSQGVKEVVILPLNTEEKAQFDKSTNFLKNASINVIKFLEDQKIK